MLGETILEARNERVAEAASAPVLDKWLPEQDSNLRPFD